MELNIGYYGIIIRIGFLFSNELFLFGHHSKKNYDEVFSKHRVNGKIILNKWNL